jgi:CBS-domain-containing membrane protein
MREWHVALRSDLSVGAAAGLLDAAGVDAAPVVDSSGRCVGVFTASDYRRSLSRGGPGAPHSEAMAGVGRHMTRQFGVTAPEADVGELLHRLSVAPDPFLVVLDRQGRPMGVVCGLDVVVAESAGGWPVQGVATADTSAGS